MSFEGKTVIVTGAGSGIGRGLAVGFCGDGARVFSIGRTREDLETTAAACDGRMQFVVGDVADEAAVDRLFEQAGAVDILVNNAARYPKTPFLEGSHADWAGIIETNVCGLALCCRKALPGMLERGYGRIINMGSFAWKGPIPGSSAYTTSKAAVSFFTRSLATEIDPVRHPDVVVNELMAGVYRTRMSEGGEDPAAAYEHVRHLAALPAGGPNGAMFLGSELYVEDPGGLRSRLKRLLRR